MGINDFRIKPRNRGIRRYMSLLALMPSLVGSFDPTSLDDMLVKTIGEEPDSFDTDEGTEFFAKYGVPERGVLDAVPYIIDADELSDGRAELIEILEELLGSAYDSIDKVNVNLALARLYQAENANPMAKQYAAVAQTEFDDHLFREEIPVGLGDEYSLEQTALVRINEVSKEVGYQAAQVPLGSDVAPDMTERYPEGMGYRDEECPYDI